MPNPRPQPWYAAFNQPPKGNPTHGRNRKPTPPTHGDPVDGADPLYGAGPLCRAVRTGLPPATWRSLNTLQTLSPGGVTYFDPRACVCVSATTPPSIPYAGIRPGEITGHRLWLVLSDLRLCSLAHYFLWKPGATIEGDVDKVVLDRIFLPSIYGGTYSFRTAKKCEREVEIQGITEVDFPNSNYFNQGAIYGIAIGTIKCWGEVVEHEHGYRAQYAKLTSIDRVIGKVDIAALRERYLL